MTNQFIDLDALPAPAVVEVLSFEELFKRKLATLVGIDPSFSALLESDPAIKLLEADAYDELILRGRINDAARARLLAFAQDGDLDQLAAFYGVERMAGEADNRLKTRVRLAIKSKSAAGSAAQYELAAMSVSLDVKAAYAFSPSGGHVTVAILAEAGDGAPSSDLLAAVSAVVTARDVSALCHTVVVVGAEIVQVDVSGSVWLNKSAPDAVFAGLPGVLRAEFEAVRALGYNVAASWITSKLQQSGVQRVQLVAPASQVAIAPNQCAVLRNIDLTLAGRDD